MFKGFSFCFPLFLNDLEWFVIRFPRLPMHLDLSPQAPASP